MQIVEQAQDGKEKETDANMTTMFEILRRNHGGIPFERLFLNKKSFSQTIENQFSLSFLIKDGRASTRKMDDGTILVGECHNSILLSDVCLTSLSSFAFI